MLHKLSDKVRFFAILFLLLIIVTAIFVVINIFSLRNTVINLTDYTIPETTISGNFNANMEGAIREIQTSLLTGEEEEFEEATEALDQAQENVTAFTQLNNEFINATENVEELTQINSQRQALLDRMQQLLVSIESESESTSDEMIETSFTALEGIEDELRDLNANASQILEQERTLATEQTITGLQWSLGGIGVSIILLFVLVVTALFLLRRYILRPIASLADATNTIASGNFDIVVPVTGDDEIGDLQNSFNVMSTTIRQQTQALADQVTVANTARTEAETAQIQLSKQLNTVEEQHEIIRAMSVPLLPLTPSVLVLPLIGALDDARLQMAIERSLASIEQQHARHLILDITGVPFVDVSVAEGIIQIIQAAQLLGTKVSLVGIRPEVAQSIIALGVDISSIKTYHSLQTAIMQIESGFK